MFLFAYQIYQQSILSVGVFSHSSCSISQTDKNFQVFFLPLFSFETFIIHVHGRETCELEHKEVFHCAQRQAAEAPLLRNKHILPGEEESQLEAAGSSLALQYSHSWSRWANNATELYLQPLIEALQANEPVKARPKLMGIYIQHEGFFLEHYSKSVCSMKPKSSHYVIKMQLICINMQSA